ncbi:dCTP deaminase/dUTPase family protein [Clostridium sp. DL1XJH146]
MKKVRGFEKISFKQFKNDIDMCENDYNIVYSNYSLPKRATDNSAGYDFYALFDIKLNKGESIIVPTGIKAYMLVDEWIGIYIRSSLGFKYNIRLKNQVGVVDSDYYNNKKNEGHIFIAIVNEGYKILEIKKGEAFAQAIFNKFLLIDNDIPKNELRVGGMGSTNEQ